jgi:hypothetical protein
MIRLAKGARNIGNDGCSTASAASCAAITFKYYLHFGF